MTLSHLILLRHGETDWNAALRLQGHRDIPLNEQGQQQAEAAAPSVAALEPDVIVASDLQRAQRTAASVAALTGHTVGADPRLRETSLGDWEGLTREEVVDGWPGMWEQWRASSADYAPPGGESRSQVADRAVGVVHDLDRTDVQRALLVAHGGLIVGLTGRLLALPREHWSVLTGVTNCHWVLLHRFGSDFDSPWRLHSYNAGLGSVVLPGGEDEVAGV
ncbi:histidine phosphatase family protein [Nakamurella lactea]|uniref:histidine phosphatase family protein n=1 Tax=Nakamurella lactea TaxID=459515 RepID=UPI00040D8911|nr:histidine phosphatase family protein [Nakamurella lactea]